MFSDNQIHVWRTPNEAIVLSDLSVMCCASSVVVWDMFCLNSQVPQLCYTCLDKCDLIVDYMYPLMLSLFAGCGGLSQQHDVTL